MKKFKEFELFYDALGELRKGELNNFAAEIIHLYQNYLHCNCFFNHRVSDARWEELLKIFEKIEDNNQDFKLNFSKGFVYLKNGLDDDALNYLNVASKFGLHLDIILNLKASINSNSNKLENAQKSVELNPSSRNFYRLAIIYENIDKVQAIEYYEIAGSKSNDFECPFANIGDIYESMGNLEKATLAYKRCLEINPFHSCYLILARCLFVLKDYTNALNYLKIARKHSNSSKFHSYNSLEKEIINEMRSKAIEAYHNAEFSKALNFYSKLIEENMEGYFSLSNLEQIIYFKLIIFVNNPEIELNDNNLKFKKFRTTYFSYLKKKNDGIELSFEEENIAKLSTYDDSKILNFGKYKGERLGKILKNDSEYILWIITNITHFSIPIYLFSLEYFNRNFKFFESLEMNFIKQRILFLKEGIQNEKWEDDYLVNERENYSDNSPSGYEDWLNNEFGDDANTAFWNLD